MDTFLLLCYGIVFLFGITVGSFLNVCILRMPKGESIVTTPSHCVHCGARLRWFELLPLFSWLALQGKCRTCRGSISAQYPLVEAANGILWVLISTILGFTPYALLGCLMTSALLALSVIDGRTGEIPQGMNTFVFCLGVIHLLLNLSAWLVYVIGFFAVSAPLTLILIATSGRGIGGGDIKLMAVCGLLLGWKLILLAFCMGCMIGSVIHVVRMRFFSVGRVLAFGPYLSVGVVIAMLWGERILKWYIGIVGL